MKNKKKRISVTLMLIFSLAFIGILSQGQVLLADYGEDLLYWGSRGKGVENLQRDLSSLGYDTYGIDGVFGSKTYDALLGFQKAQGISVDGIAGPESKQVLEECIRKQCTYFIQQGDTLSALAYQYGTTVSAIMEANNLDSYMIYAGDSLFIPGQGATISPSRGESRYGELLDWWTEASKIFSIGKVATITDLDTGISYQVVRKGGSNHADCQPLTAEDTAKMKKARGGVWSWDRRAIIVEVDGRRLAASQNGMPHGGQSIYDNDFPGHFCIHFLNSRTHGTNRVDEAHQSMVEKAAGL